MTRKKNMIKKNITRTYDVTRTGNMITNKMARKKMKNKIRKNMTKENHDHEEDEGKTEGDIIDDRAAEDNEVHDKRDGDKEDQNKLDSDSLNDNNKDDNKVASTECVKSLQLTETSDVIKDPRTSLYDARRMRKKLRENELEAWAKLPQKGLGEELYSEFIPANSWIRHQLGTTFSVGDATEPETLAHVLGSCPHGEVLRNSRHHRIRSMIAEQFRPINYQVFEEVHGLADNGSTRRIDMIAIPPNNNNGYIIDPTVRFEKQKSQPEDVNREKNIMDKVALEIQSMIKTNWGTELYLYGGSREGRPGLTWFRLGAWRALKIVNEEGEIICPLCGRSETLHHILSECEATEALRKRFLPGKNDAETGKEEEKELIGSLAEKKLPTERCNGRNGEREKSLGWKKISEDRQYFKVYGSNEETKRKAENRKDWRKLSLQ
ncbi:hypothetical protein ANN_14833 [Periplaneta americana]|uniref:Uncharacterized protein n=1 Tax=Periplaneta americana TaxID=6978 RepID=A0ABQ8SXE2_PERAM|nr:hypothetical protein ANN_14833 [Periplaneta americana]